MSGARATWLATAAVLTAIALPASAQAQLGGSLTVATDYRLRGLSLTDRRSALSLAATYDHMSGAYAGGMLIGHDPARSGARILGHMEYLGVAGGKPGGPTWDVGVNNVDLELRLARRISIAYTEAYVGVSQGPWSARLSLAPDYPRKGVETAYLDLNATTRPAEAWRVFGHAGALVRLGGSNARDGRGERFDLQAGVAREFDRGEVFLSGTATFPRPQPYTSGSEAGLIVGATLYF